MWASYEPNVKATFAFLELLKVKVNNATVDETLQSHPDWPSLLCISDSLHKWQIPNAAAKEDIIEIDQLPTPFIAVTTNRQFPLAVVNSVKEKTIGLFQTNYKKQQLVPQEEFLKNWKEGIYLIAETNTKSGEKDYKINKRKQIAGTMLPVLFLLLAISISLWLLQPVSGYSALQKTGIWFQFAIMLLGSLISGLLLWYEMDKNNPMLQKVCTGFAKTSCNAILSGKAAKVFNWLSWSGWASFILLAVILLHYFFRQTR